MRIAQNSRSTTISVPEFRDRLLKVVGERETKGGLATPGCREVEEEYL